MKRLFRKLIKLFMKFNSAFFFNNEKIIFQSFGGRNYSGNPKAIYLELAKQEQNLTYVWAFKKPKDYKSFFPSGIKLIKINSLSYFYHLATAKIWIDDFEKMNFILKSNKQTYIQTYHGDRSFKKILNDARDMGYMLEEDKCDYITTGSLLGEQMMRSALKYKGEFLKFGSPRNDALMNIDPNAVTNIKKTLRIDINSKVLLYAPTFRDSKIKDEVSLDKIFPGEKILAALNKHNNHKWIILTRTHPSAKGFNISKNQSDIIDVSRHPDMAELLMITDLLVTDYSSSATDFILRNKPVILYQYDKDHYENNERNFYYQIENVGFSIAYNLNEFINLLESILTKNHEKVNQKIREFYGTYESGNASFLVAQHILELLDKN